MAVLFFSSAKTVVLFIERNHGVRSITLAYEKILKLTNAVTVKIGEADFERIDVIVEKLENYIKAKGYMPMAR